MTNRHTLLAASVLLGSCVTATTLREDTRIIDKKIKQARDRGAMHCAPKQLAEAETHLEFFVHELDQGDQLQAKAHRFAALRHVHRAIEMSDPNECSEEALRRKADRDKDGVPDAEDRCPDEPEDKDNFEDNDGCPEPDNDGDTVLDVNDKCPLIPGDPTEQGCPLADRDSDGIGDAVDQCPDVPEDLDGNQDDDGCPEDDNIDSDGDGILDAQDQCPAEPEDKDLFQDEDGCPDPDNDLDTVLDVEDACPLQAGSPEFQGCPNRDRDGDGINDDVDQCPDVPGKPPTGCPGRVLVEKKGDRIEIKKKIRFQTGRARIRGRTSFEILDQVAAVFVSNPEIKVMIEGHTDSRGSASYNQRLSAQRAAAVRQALVERGVAADRLQSEGYGEEKPIASNNTRSGRAANRRVEFKIINAQPETSEPSLEVEPSLELMPPPPPPQ